MLTKFMFVCILGCVLNIYLIEGHKSLWVFGKNDPPPDSVPIEPLQGEIGVLQRITKIPLLISSCLKIVQVRVLVNNLLSTPEVKFSQAANTVTISYRPTQSSTSTYQVSGDAVMVPQCVDYNDEDAQYLSFDNNDQILTEQFL